MKSALFYFDSLDELPVYNWSMLHKTDQLEWLCRDRSRTLTRVEVTKLNSVYVDMVYQFTNVNRDVLVAKRDIIIKIIDLILEIAGNSKDIDKMQKASLILRALIVTPDPLSTWLFDVDFTETSQQKNLLTEIAIKIEKYNRKKQRLEDHPQSLNEKVVKIETLLGVHIDPKVCSVALFTEYEKQAINKIKEIKLSTHGTGR